MNGGIGREQLRSPNRGQDRVVHGKLGYGWVEQ